MDLWSMERALQITRIAAAFIVSGDRLISRIKYRTFAVRHNSSSDIRDTSYAARNLTETSFTPILQYLARVNTDAHIKAVV